MASLTGTQHLSPSAQLMVGQMPLWVWEVVPSSSVPQCRVWWRHGMNQSGAGRHPAHLSGSRAETQSSCLHPCTPVARCPAHLQERTKERLCHQLCHQPAHGPHDAPRNPHSLGHSAGTPSFAMQTKRCGTVSTSGETQGKSLQLALKPPGVPVTQLCRDHGSKHLTPLQPCLAPLPLCLTRCLGIEHDPVAAGLHVVPTGCNGARSDTRDPGLGGRRKTHVRRCLCFGGTQRCGWSSAGGETTKHRQRPSAPAELPHQWTWHYLEGDNTNIVMLEAVYRASFSVRAKAMQLLMFWGFGASFARTGRQEHPGSQRCFSLKLPQP